MGFFGTLGYYICIPFAALLRLFYNLTGSYGVAIILFTIVIKLITRTSSSSFRTI